MQQCDSPYVVKYYGSYFKNTDLWVRAHRSWSCMKGVHVLEAILFVIYYYIVIYIAFGCCRNLVAELIVFKRLVDFWL